METAIFNTDGRGISSRTRLDLIRKKVSQQAVNAVHLISEPPGTGHIAGHGVLVLQFEDGFTAKAWDDFEVLKKTLRTWKNLWGVKLFVSEKAAGEVSKDNPALQKKSIFRIVRLDVIIGQEDKGEGEEMATATIAWKADLIAQACAKFDQTNNRRYNIQERINGQWVTWCGYQYR